MSNPTYDETYRTQKLSGFDNVKSHIMLHHTGPYQTELGIVKYLAENAAQVSCHYVVGQEGKVWKLADHEAVTWHAGSKATPASFDTPEESMNHAAIGIEICSRDGITYTDQQRSAVVALVRTIMDQENIPATNVIRHWHWAGARGKWDVGPAFYEPFGTWGQFQMHLEDFGPCQKAIQDQIEFNSKCWHMLRGIQFELEQKNDNLRSIL